MHALKEPERITLDEGLKLLERHLPTDRAKARLRQAFVQKALDQEPKFALPYDEAEIEWATGAVKIPKKPDRFRPTFRRVDFERYFFEDRMARPSYERQTVISAADMLKALGHSGFERFLLELNLPDPSVGRGNGLMARATSLAQYAIDNPEQLTPERRTVAYEIIRRAAQLFREGVSSNLSAGEREKFAAAIQREGQAHMLSGEQDNLALWRPQRGDNASAPLNASQLLAQDQSQGAAKTRPLPRKVFVVHGHEGEPREAVARFLVQLDFVPIILHEQTNQGRTVIEKFEAHADVGFAVVLLTPDDHGGSHDGAQQPRARQNVILEWGYFIGRLGRSHVCALKKGDLELPSDILGLVWEPFDEHGAWKQKFAKELEDAGFTIDWRKVGRP